ncbi:MAG: hypothetical protein QOI80_2838 [Solirubrobacteraceae bacterium]|nr:hypothetical protein [Solirubrobacteraceae bacterium]
MAIDTLRLDELAALARAVPGVGDAAAVVRQTARATAPPADVAAAPTPPPEPPPATGKPPALLYGGDLVVPDGGAMTLQDALRQAADLAPGKGIAFIRRDREDTLVTFPELLDAAQRVLAGLRAAGLQPGDPALFVFADNRDYITAYWACVLGGFVPTPVAVAPSYRSFNETTRKLQNAWALLGRPVLLTDAGTAPDLAGVRGLWDEPDVRILVVGELERSAPDADWFATTPDSPVMNLLTSGSTGVPKCVQHTNASIAARTWATAQARGYTADDVSVMWMPLDHVTMVYYGVRDVFLRALHVNAHVDHAIGDPLLWLDWMDRYQATNTWAPNFAFALINEQADEVARGSWDLSRVREFVNAGEPVIAGVCRRFAELLAPHGLRPDAVTPCWGMSETCSGVTYTRQHRDDPTAGVVTVAASSLSGDIRHVDPGDEQSVSFSTVGPPIPGVTIRIVAPDGSVMPQDRVGELQIRGVTMLRGYFNNEQANRDAFDADGWFKTGDLAFIHGDAVIIAGRAKDEIIIRGINYIAHELESVVEQVDGVRVTFVAAAGIREPGEGSDRLAVFFVPASWDDDVLERTLKAARSALVREAGLAPDLLVPVTDAEFPKTASGKIQRGKLVEELQAGRFADRVSADEPAAEPDTWFCTRGWSELEAPTGPAAGGTCLVLADEAQLARLGIAGEVVAVGSAEALEAALTRAGPFAAAVLAWPLPGETTDADPAARTAAVTEQVTAAIRALATLDAPPPLLVLSAGAVHVQPGDRIDLGACALPGLIRTAAAEGALPAVRLVDLPRDAAQWPAAVNAELADRSRSGVVAVRDGVRRRPGLVPVADTDAQPPLAAGGVYLVTGGLGGIAHDLASYLLAAYGIRLLLVGRSPADGDKAGALAELQAFGEVRYRQVDVADAPALATAVAEAEAHWGRPLDGVLHLAGADPTGQWEALERHLLTAESPETFAAMYHAKVAGTLAIAALLEDRPRARLVLFGSVNGEFGGHAFGAYSAANSFLVGFADHWRHERERDVHCLAWSMWTNIGMNRGQPAGPARRRGFMEIDREAGLRAFLSALAMPHHYVLVGLDLANPMIVAELDPSGVDAQEVVLAYAADDATPDALREALERPLGDCPFPVRLLEVAMVPRDASGAVDTAQLLVEAAKRRPGGKREFAAPETDTEHRIATIFAEVLDRDAISRDDSFFDLGGNSLRATRLLARVDDTLAVRLTTQVLYENPTVAELAAAVDRDD